jgi:hypothetical protein
VRASAFESHIATTSWRITLESLEPYLTIETLRERLATIHYPGLNAEDKQAADALREAIERHDRGLPDSEFGWN